LTTDEGRWLKKQGTTISVVKERLSVDILRAIVNLKPLKEVKQLTKAFNHPSTAVGHTLTAVKRSLNEVNPTLSAVDVSLTAVDHTLSAVDVSSTAVDHTL
jgi:hypothetical protein